MNMQPMKAVFRGRLMEVERVDFRLETITVIKNDIKFTTSIYDDDLKILYYTGINISEDGSNPIYPGDKVRIKFYSRDNDEIPVTIKEYVVTEEGLLGFGFAVTSKHMGWDLRTEMKRYGANFIYMEKFGNIYEDGDLDYRHPSEDYKRLAHNISE